MVEANCVPSLGLGSPIPKRREKGAQPARTPSMPEHRSPEHTPKGQSRRSQRTTGQLALSREARWPQTCSSLLLGAQESKFRPLALTPRRFGLCPSASPPCLQGDVPIHTPASLRATVSAVPSAHLPVLHRRSATPPPSSSPLQLKRHSCLPTHQTSLGRDVTGTTLWLMNLALRCGPGYQRCHGGPAPCLAHDNPSRVAY